MKKVLIIAEAGVNHNGSLETAKKLVDAACESGADIVKFQTAKLGSLVTKYAPMAGYQKENMREDSSQAQMLKRLLLPFDDFKELSQYCKMVGIQFLSTPFDLDIRLALWSGPSIPRSNVKCFSITVAPIATAATGISIPRVWSEYPTWHPKVSRSVSIAFKFTSWYGVGYWVVQCSNVISPLLLQGRVLWRRVG